MVFGKDSELLKKATVTLMRMRRALTMHKVLAASNIMLIIINF